MKNFVFTSHKEPNWQQGNLSISFAVYDPYNRVVLSSKNMLCYFQHHSCLIDLCSSSGLREGFNLYSKNRIISVDVGSGRQKLRKFMRSK